MNFKRPCWLALFISLGMMLVGFLATFGMASFWFDKAAPDWHMLMGDGFYLLMAVGVLGFVVSLIWWFVAAIISSIRSHRQRS